MSLHSLLLPARLGTLIEVHDCHTRARFWGGPPPRFLLWHIPGHCWTWTGLQAAFVSLHDRFTVPNSAHKVVCGVLRRWFDFLSSQRCLWGFLHTVRWVLLEPARFPQSPMKGQWGDSTGGELPLLLLLSFLDGAEDFFPSPWLTGLLGGPQGHWWPSRWILEGVWSKHFQL